MPITATAGPAVSAVSLARLVASSATFQTLTGSVNASAAMQRISLFEAADVSVGDPPTLDRPRPRAIIRNNRYALNSQQGLDSNESFNLVLQFEFLPSDTAVNGGIDDEYIEFSNRYGAILAEMMANKNDNGGYDSSGNALFQVSRFETVDEPAPSESSDDAALEYFWGVRFDVIYGDGD